MYRLFTDGTVVESFSLLGCGWCGLPSFPSPTQPGGEQPRCRACPGLANKVSIVRVGVVWPLRQEVHIQRLGAEVITMVIQ